MKKFTKLFLSCAAAAALTAAVATSAMAAEHKSLKVGAYTLDASGTFGTVTIETETPDDMKTLLVLNKGKDLTNFDPEAGDVLQIDQNGTIATVKLPALSEDNESHKGTYMVYMGGTSGDIYAGSFTIGGSPVKIGDANLDGKVIAQDASMTLEFAVKKNASMTGSKAGAVYNSADGKDGVLLIGDANVDGKVIAQDASMILEYAVKKNATMAGSKAGTEVMASPAAAE